MKPPLPNPFDAVKRIGLTLPDVEAATRYDGSPVLKIAGVFVAGLATHRSAEPSTLVVRADLGGEPITAIRCDHGDDEQVDAVFQRIVDEA